MYFESNFIKRKMYHFDKCCQFQQLEINQISA